MHSFFLKCLLADEMEITGRDAHHISRVLRMQPGELVRVADTAGQSAVARILRILPERVLLVRDAQSNRQTEATIRLWLAQGLPKADKFEFIVQKAVELGAAGIIPMRTEHTVVRYDEGKEKSKIERWQKIAEEAAKQSGRQLIPAVTRIHTLPEVLDRLEPDTTAIMPYEQEQGCMLAEALTRQTCQEILLLIGPEGGFSPQEAEACRRRGVHTVSLGPRILRTETAALAMVAILMHRFGDLGSR